MSEKCHNSCPRRCYSITSSARCWRNSGTSMPSALAVLRLIASSKVAGCSTGRSAGFCSRSYLHVIAARRVTADRSDPYENTPPSWNVLPGVAMPQVGLRGH